MNDSKNQKYHDSKCTFLQIILFYKPVNDKQLKQNHKENNHVYFLFDIVSNILLNLHDWKFFMIECLVWVCIRVIREQRLELSFMLLRQRLVWKTRLIFIQSNARSYKVVILLRRLRHEHKLSLLSLIFLTFIFLEVLHCPMKYFLIFRKWLWNRQFMVKINIHLLLLLRY